MSKDFEIMQAAETLMGLANAMYALTGRELVQAEGDTVTIRRTGQRAVIAPLVFYDIDAQVGEIIGFVGKFQNS